MQTKDCAICRRMQYPNQGKTVITQKTIYFLCQPCHSSLVASVLNNLPVIAANTLPLGERVEICRERARAYAQGDWR